MKTFCQIALCAWILTLGYLGSRVLVRLKDAIKICQSAQAAANEATTNANNSIIRANKYEAQCKAAQESAVRAQVMAIEVLTRLSFEDGVRYGRIAGQMFPEIESMPELQNVASNFCVLKTNAVSLVEFIQKTHEKFAMLALFEKLGKSLTNGLAMTNLPVITNFSAEIYIMSNAPVFTNWCSTNIIEGTNRFHRLEVEPQFFFEEPPPNVHLLEVQSQPNL